MGVLLLREVRLMRTLESQRDGLCRSNRSPSTVWRRYIVCLKLQVSFRKRATNYRALLWEMTYRDKASYGSLQQMTHMYHMAEYGVATISRLLKIIGLFCRI